MDCKCSVCACEKQYTGKPEIVNKPWGKEIIWAKAKDKYLGKILCIDKDHQLSLQHHSKKTESMFILKGKVKFTLGESLNKLSTSIIEEGSTVHLEPGLIHRLFAIEDSEVLEVSTYYPEDITRHLDDYSRE